MRKFIFTLFAFACIGTGTSAYALNTASSFDISYGYANLTIQSLVDGESTNERTFTSPTGIEIDYNVALFDYKTVATLSFAQFMTSNIGDRAMTRIALGASYHFVHMNGQRVILDNQVEGKSWGISPALELTLGLNYLSIADPENKNFQFTNSLIDVLPRLVIEVPASPSFLIVFRVGYLNSLSAGGGNSRYGIKYSGLIANIGFKLTTF